MVKVCLSNSLARYTPHTYIHTNTYRPTHSPLIWWATCNLSNSTAKWLIRDEHFSINICTIQTNFPVNIYLFAAACCCWSLVLWWVRQNTRKVCTSEKFTVIILNWKCSQINYTRSWVKPSQKRKKMPVNIENQIGIHSVLWCAESGQTNRWVSGEQKRASVTKLNRNSMKHDCWHAMKWA